MGSWYERSNPDRPIENRPVSSFAILEHRYGQVEEALSYGDESAIRYELRELAAEASKLAAQDPLFP